MAPHTGQIVESSAAACRHFTWRSEDDTAAFARRLAAQPLIGNAYLTLHGDLGAGKTTLVRYLLRALGVQGRIKSPSYAVVEPYGAPHPAPNTNTTTTTMIWHFDFYRFDDPREWEDAGFRELFAQPGLKLAEWPQKAAALAPPADLAIHIHTTDDDGSSRQVTLHAHSRTGRSLLQGLVSA